MEGENVYAQCPVECSILHFSDINQGKTEHKVPLGLAEMLVKKQFLSHGGKELEF